MFKKVSLPTETSCLNCGHNVEELQYCSKCGQENVTYKVSIRKLLSHYLGKFFTLDTKLVRTVVCLLSKPWQLSQSFIEGKRKTYTNPFRIYLITSVLFIFALKVQKSYTPDNTSNPLIIKSTVGKGEKELGAKQINEYFTKQLSNAFLVSIPFMGLILYGLYFRSKKWYFIDHLILMTHFYALAYLLSLPFFFFKLLNPYSALIFVVLSVYLWLMMKKFYAQSALKTTLKFLLFNFLCVIAFAFIMAGFLLLYIAQIEIMDVLGLNV